MLMGWIRILSAEFLALEKRIGFSLILDETSGDLLLSRRMMGGILLLGGADAASLRSDRSFIREVG